MKQSVFMRVLFCKIQCPSFICFCKPSAAHLYAPGPLKLENSQNAPANFASVTADDVVSTGEIKEQRRRSENGGLKSCIRRKAGGEEEAVDKKKVQWMDSLGKELADIKEFESSETGDTDSEEYNRGCVCTIL